MNLEKNVEYPSHKLILRRCLLEVKSKGWKLPIFLYLKAV
jgi:hypothetical protein